MHIITINVTASFHFTGPNYRGEYAISSNQRFIAIWAVGTVKFDRLVISLLRSPEVMQSTRLEGRHSYAHAETRTDRASTSESVYWYSGSPCAFMFIEVDLGMEAFR